MRRFSLCVQFALLAVALVGCVSPAQRRFTALSHRVAAVVKRHAPHAAIARGRTYLAASLVPENTEILRTLAANDTPGGEVVGLTMDRKFTLEMSLGPAKFTTAPKLEPGPSASSYFGSAPFGKDRSLNVAFTYDRYQPEEFTQVVIGILEKAVERGGSGKAGPSASPKKTSAL